MNPVDSPYYLSEQLNYLAAKDPATRKEIITLETSSLAHIDNTSAVLLTLSAQVLCLYYEELHSKGNFSVRATVLIGKVNAGKSTACCAALAIHFITSITDSKAKALTNSTTLGVVFDDPKDALDIADKILHHFDVVKQSM